jgi:hypothetical protein
MRKSEPMTIQCDLHREQVAAVICTHMRRGQPSPSGFIENVDGPNDLQAWCYQYEARFTEENGMTPGFKAFNNMSIVCVPCYLEAKQRHAMPTC